MRTLTLNLNVLYAKSAFRDWLDARVVLYFAVLAAGAATEWGITTRMTHQANQHLLPDQQIVPTIWTWSETCFKGGERRRLTRVHRRFFPDSTLRYWRAVVEVLTLLWMFLGLWILYR